MAHDHRDSRHQSSHAGRPSSRSVHDIDFEAEHDPEAARRWSNMKLMRARQELAAERSGSDAAKAPPGAAARVDRAANESGAPLPDEVRGRFESSLGADLSGVRVHTGSASAAAAESIGAKAYTTGQDIHFGAGQYDPSSKEGQRLLAHEVAHTVQQGSAATAPPQAKLAISSPVDPHEHEADRAASAMLEGAAFSVGSVDRATNRAAHVQRKPAAHEQQRGLIDMPEEYVGKSGARALADFVERTERDVSAIASGIDQVSSPESLVAAGCKRILVGFEEVDAALNASPPKADQVRGLMQRLDAAIGRLFSIARQHRIPMRDTGLEAVFDREDHLRVRKDISYGGRANRAEHYYDADLSEPQRENQSAPDAGTVAQDLGEGRESGEASNRDELIREIEGLEARMWWALDQAYELAAAAINEPDMPREPSLLERLAEMAVAMLIAHANTALGGILDVAVSGAKAKRVVAGARTALRERVGKDTARALLAGFAAAGKGAVSQGVQIGIGQLSKPEPRKPSLQEQVGFNPDGLAASPKRIYLVRAHAHTNHAKEVTSKAFIDVSSELKRLPVETLRELHESFDAEVFRRITNAFRGLLVQEWVNFVKVASDKGYEMRDDATRDRELGTKESTKIGNALLPAGVVRIRVTVGPEGQVTFKDASLPGVTTSVRHEVRRMEKPLSSLAMHRRIELAAPSPVMVPGGGFDVDPSGQIVSIEGIHGAARGAVAAVAHPVRAAVFNDADVFAGALALLQKLHMHTSSEIKEAE